MIFLLKTVAYTVVTIIAHIRSTHKIQKHGKRSINTMKNLTKLVLPCLMLVTTSVTAQVIDFKAAANITEKGYSVINLNSTPGLNVGLDIDIFGKYVDATGVHDAYAYMDKGNAGLGVCKALDSSDQCTPSSDDNVTGTTGDNSYYEYLLFEFNEAVTITGMWFNNNHDPDRHLDGDTITIGSDDVTFALGDIDAARSSGINSNNNDYLYDTDLSFNAGDSLIISYYSGDTLRADEFYLSAISVPEPATLALLGLGLTAFGIRRRRRS